MKPVSSPGKGIYLRGNIYWLKFQRNGRRDYTSLNTSDPAEAVQRAGELRRSPHIPAASKLSQTIERYVSHKEALNVFSRATARITRASLREFATRVEVVPFVEIKTGHIAAHYKALRSRVAETTAQIHMRAIKAFFSWCEKERVIIRSPAKEIQLATIDRPARLRFCTAEERNALIDNAPTDDLRFILYCGFHCGMRKGEIIEARAGWFDLRDDGPCHIENTPTFRIKDRDARFVPLTGVFRNFLRDYIGGADRHAFALRPGVAHGKGTYRYDFHRPFNDYLAGSSLCCGRFTRFTGEACCRLCRKTISLRWVTAHVMRHTFASLLVQKGVSVFKVARWLGDGVEVVEKHYAHLAPQDKDIERML